MVFKEFKRKFEKVPVIEYSNAVTNKPLVSICVQTYQHVNYIRKCLDGILIQETNFEFEILLGEDASTDGTREICIKYANKYPAKIRLYLHHRENNIAIDGSPTGRFNFLYNLYSAKGKYIALCEGDDYWTDPNKLQKQVDFLEVNEDYNICFHNVKIYEQRTSSLLNDTITRNVQDTTTIKDLVLGNYIHTLSVVFRNNFKIPKWYKESSIGDWALYMIIIKEKKIYKINDIMGVYRLHNISIWSNLSQNTRNDLTNKSKVLVLNNVKLPDATEQVLKKSQTRNVNSFIITIKNKVKSFLN